MQAVFDVTPGSGALMEAAMTRGIQYYGACPVLSSPLLCLHLGRCAPRLGHNTQHLQWLQTIADRAACGLLVLEGSSLYSDECAKAVKKHFADVLYSRLSLSWR